MKKKVTTALTIAGSDPSGGAGIQADLKVFTAHHIYGASVITCLTAQNTQSVSAMEAVNPDMVQQQLQAVFSDLNIKFVKTGALASDQIINTVASFLNTQSHIKLIVDPVMVSKSGFKILPEDAIQVLKTKLINQCFLVTPNVYEAELLAHLKISTIDDVKKACLVIAGLGAQNVLLKGGHLKGDPIDVLYECASKSFSYFAGQRHNNQFTHGTGCSLSSAIVANLCQNMSLQMAIEKAKQYVNRGIKNGLVIGRGINPINFN